MIRCSRVNFCILADRKSIPAQAVKSKISQVFFSSICGLSGGLFTSLAACSTVFAKAKEVVELGYAAYGKGPIRDPGQGDIRIQMNGGAKLYLKTGMICFTSNITIGLYLGQNKLDWKHNERIKILFKLFDKDGQLIAYFDNIYETEGKGKELARFVDPEILSRVVKIAAAISLG